MSRSSCQGDYKKKMKLQPLALLVLTNSFVFIESVVIGFEDRTVVVSEFQVVFQLCASVVDNAPVNDEVIIVTVAYDQKSALCKEQLFII